MENPFQHVMAQLSDAQINALMLSQQDYVPQALQAARSELRARGMSVLELETLSAEGEVRAEIAEAKAELPLSLRDQLLYFIFAFLVATPFVGFFYAKFAERGEDKRAWMSMRQVLLGLLTYVAAYGVLQRFFFDA